VTKLNGDCINATTVRDLDALETGMCVRYSQ
jgi:hypothetical protein